MEEIWKDIEGYEGLYQVSNLGRVKSLQSRWERREKVLRINNLEKKYIQLSLHKLGNKKNMYVHRLVAKAFIPNELNALEVNHKDGNKSNNNVNNLEWCTHLENMRHCFDNNLRPSSDFQKQKMSEIKSRAVIDSVTGIIYKSLTEASIIYSISQPYLSQMLSGIYPNKTNLQYYNPTKQ
jgi:hypothetical protein